MGGKPPHRPQGTPSGLGLAGRVLACGLSLGWDTPNRPRQLKPGLDLGCPTPRKSPDRVGVIAYPPYVLRRFSWSPRVFCARAQKLAFHGQPPPGARHGILRSLRLATRAGVVGHEKNGIFYRILQDFTGGWGITERVPESEVRATQGRATYLCLYLCFAYA